MPMRPCRARAVLPSSKRACLPEKEDGGTETEQQRRKSRAELHGWLTALQDGCRVFCRRAGRCSARSTAETSPGWSAGARLCRREAPTALAEEQQQQGLKRAAWQARVRQCRMLVLNEALRAAACAPTHVGEGSHGQRASLSTAAQIGIGPARISSETRIQG